MKKAFTLIELLVVIAIIAILAAILFPVFAQAKVAAKKTTSLSNVKQMNLGIILYTGDTDDVLPAAFQKVATPVADAKPADYKTNGYGAWTWTGDPNDENPTSIFWTWGQVTYPYHKSIALFRDPVGPNANGNPGLSNFGANFDLMGTDIWNPAHPMPGSTTALDDVAGKLLIVSAGHSWVYHYDLLTPGFYGAFNYVPGVCPEGKPVDPMVNCSMVNGTSTDPDIAKVSGDIKNGRAGGVNIGWADGHAKFMKSSALVAKKASAWCNTKSDNPWMCEWE
ncbi:prepilin-type N-terminal cleavage/methylation domain-containing protein [bacterium]|nr:MAG: prepilin-type N-terminal cleavage/methylation domain-containing protein [bacterium]